MLLYPELSSDKAFKREAPRCCQYSLMITTCRLSMLPLFNILEGDRIDEKGRRGGEEGKRGGSESEIVICYALILCIYSVLS